MTILTRSDLDEILKEGCAEPGCEHHHEKMSELFLNPQCHPKQGVDCCYNAEGILMLSCRVCERPICNIKVGE